MLHMADASPTLTVSQLKDISVVEFTNNKILDEANIEEIKTTLFGLIEAKATPKLLLDFGNVDHDAPNVCAGFGALRQFLAAIDLLAINVDFEPAFPNGGQSDGDVPVVPGHDLGCHTGSLPEVASRDAVLDLQTCFCFGHASSMPGPFLTRLLQHCPVGRLEWTQHLVA